MSSLSVSGKSWILKKFNQEELSFYKENFSLDENNTSKGNVEIIPTNAST